MSSSGSNVCSLHSSSSLESIKYSSPVIFVTTNGPQFALRPIYRARNRKRTRTFSLMFVAYFLICCACWWLVRATYVVDGRFFAHFFWKVEGSSEHTRESRAAHVCHVQLTCGGELSRVAHMCHVWQLTCTLLLYGGGSPHVWLTCVTCGN